MELEKKAYIKERIKDFFQKGNYTKIKLIIAFICSIMIAILYRIKFNAYSIDTIVIISAIVMFALMHLIIKLDKIYNFIYKYRYYIAGIALIIITLCEYSGSSIGIYNEIIPSEEQNCYYTPVAGTYRTIRGDEWAVNTPVMMSQVNDSENKFSYYNDNLRGTKTDMFLIVSPAIIDVLEIAKPFNIGYILFGAAKGLSIAWYGKWIALMLIAFEFCMLITKKKKLISLCGMLMIVFSSATQWWCANEILIWGMLLIILIDKFLRTEETRKKILYTVGIFVSAVSYLFIMYPAWQVPYGYIYLFIFIALCIINRKEYKFKKTDTIYVIAVIIGIGLLFYRFLLMSKEGLQLEMGTDYPGKRFEIGGGGLRNLISYVYAFFLPYRDVENACEYSGMLSFYPIPTIISCIALIKLKNKEKCKEKNDHMVFLIPLIVLSVLFSIFAIIPTNETFSKYTLLYLSTGPRISLPLGLIQIIMIVYLLSLVETEKIKLMSKKLAIPLTIICSGIIFYFATKTAPENYTTPLKLYVCTIALLIPIYLLFTMDKEKNRKVLIMFCIIDALITGIYVNPIQKGLSVITNKPISQEVKRIVSSDKENNLWITDNLQYYYSNYILANGAKVLNSTNVYPNFDLYKTILSEEDYNNKDIKYMYNRYAHVLMEINKYENKIELIYGDCLKIYLTPEKVKNLNIKYILTTRDLTEFSEANVNFEEEYSEYGLKIYKVQ